MTRVRPFWDTEWCYPMEDLYLYFATAETNAKPLLTMTKLWRTLYQGVRKGGRKIARGGTGRERVCHHFAIFMALITGDFAEHRLLRQIPEPFVLKR